MHQASLFKNKASTFTWQQQERKSILEINMTFLYTEKIEMLTNFPYKEKNISIHENMVEMLLWNSTI